MSRAKQLTPSRKLSVQGGGKFGIGLSLYCADLMVPKSFLAFRLPKVLCVFSIFQFYDSFVQRVAHGAWQMVLIC